MEKVTVSLGPFQVPVRTLRNGVGWPFRQLAGTPPLSHEVNKLGNRVDTMSEVLLVVVADLIDKWSPEQRERVLKTIAHFGVANGGLSRLKAQQNPFRADEIERLQEYTRRAEQAGYFSPEEARDFRELSERAADEYAGQDWVTELLKIAFFIFALYALGELLNPKQKAK